MLRLQTRYLLAAVSSLVVGGTTLLAGCLSGGSRDCPVGEGVCRDDRTELVCVNGVSSTRVVANACLPSEHCQMLGTAGGCLPSLEGGSCKSHVDCLDQPLCLDGACSPLPPLVVSACNTAVTLDVPTIQTGPDGATLATTFEPGTAAVAAVIALDSTEAFASPCGPKTAGPERVITLNVPASPQNPEGVRLVVKVEGLDPGAVAGVAELALSTCATPATLLVSACAQSSSGAALLVPVSFAGASTVSIVLQSTSAITATVPFTVRAQLVSLKSM